MTDYTKHMHDLMLDQAEERAYLRARASAAIRLVVGVLLFLPAWGASSMLLGTLFGSGAGYHVAFIVGAVVPIGLILWWARSAFDSTFRIKAGYPWEDRLAKRRQRELGGRSGSAAGLVIRSGDRTSGATG
jgi:hypothetical protein